jgi:hypothetical protein
MNNRVLDFDRIEDQTECPASKKSHNPKRHFRSAKIFHLSRAYQYTKPRRARDDFSEHYSKAVGPDRYYHAAS